jgi:uncharacterized protein YbaP (TraB family)
MKKLLSPLLLLVLPSLIVCTCKAQQAPGDKSLLWRISGNGLAKPSYLFGTMHLLCPDDYLWTDAMRRGLAACDKVCFEMDMDDPSVLAETAAGLMDTSGKSLRDYFTEDQYVRLQRFVRDSMGVDLSQLQMMNPVILQTLFLARAVNCNIPVSYEANIMEEAGKTGKEIIGLESVREQLDVFGDIPDDSAAAMVMSMVDSFAESKAEFARMLASYKAQDLPALHRQVKQSKELGDQLGVFLDDRNRKWIPRMMPLMKGGPVFFAVGAAHLYGETGVINLLRKKGYTVTAVR